MHRFFFKGVLPGETGKRSKKRENVNSKVGWEEFDEKANSKAGSLAGTGIFLTSITQPLYGKADFFKCKNMLYNWIVFP